MFWGRCGDRGAILFTLVKGRDSNLPPEGRSKFGELRSTDFGRGDAALARLFRVRKGNAFDVEIVDYHKG